MPDRTTSTTVGSWTYHWGGVPRPFVHPVTTPSGVRLTVDSPVDHPWHHALWFTIKFVNGENFWEEYDRFGLLVQESPPVLTSPAEGITRADSRVDWHRPAEPGSDRADIVIRETRTMQFSRLADDAAAMDWDIALAPTVDVTLDRTPFTTWGGYGGLTLRGRPDWHDTVLRLTDGDGRARVLGDRSQWCSLHGPVGPGANPDEPAAGGPMAGEAVAGIAMFDHPENPNHPTPWYASTRADTYGDEGWSNFVNAAFLWDGPLEVRSGEQLRLRYRFIAHDERWEPGQIAEQWTEWSRSPPGPREAPR